MRFHQPHINEIFSIKDLLELKPYYTIGILLMAFDGNFAPMLHFHGERNTFLHYKATIDYSNFLRNIDYRHYPIGINQQGHIVRPSYHVASALIAGLQHVSYMTCPEGSEESGLDWIKDYKKKDQIVEYYNNIPTRFNL